MLLRVWYWLLARLGYDTRVIYEYFDGCRVRRIDPLDVLRKLFAETEFDWDDTPKQLETGVISMQLEASAKITKVIRKAFDLPSFDRGGLAEIECVALLNDFRAYMGDLKKNGSLFPTSPVSPESESKPPTEANDFPTRPGAGFGSMPPELCSVPPGSTADPTTKT